MIRSPALAAFALLSAPLRAEEATPLPEPGALAPPPLEVVVRAAPAPSDADEQRIPAGEARRVAGTQGDPVKIVEDLPGSGRASLADGELVLWGAAPDETRVLVDGVEIPALFHGAALRGTVHGDLLESVSVMPGAYGVEFGRGIGGIVSLTTRRLSDDRARAALDLNTLDGSVRASTPIGGSAELLLAGRYGWLDHVLDAVGVEPEEQYFSVPRYFDAQAKLSVDLGRQRSLDWVVLGSHDASSFREPDRDPARARGEEREASFARIAARYRQSSASASVEITPWIGFDANDHSATFGARAASTSERSFRVGLRAADSSRLHENVGLELGADLAARHARLSRSGSLTIPALEGDLSVFGQPPGDDASSDSWHTAQVDVAPYALIDLALGPLTLSPGLRIDAFLLEVSRKTPRVGETPDIGQSSLEVVLGPRLKARLSLSRRVAFFGAVGRYSQPPDPALTSAVFGSPTLPIASASHATLGESVELTPTLSSTVQGFYRYAEQLPARASSPSPKLAEALTADGVAKSYGVTIWIRQRPWFGFSGWVAYTLSRSLRKSQASPDFRRFDADQPHVFTVVLGQRLGPWSLSGRFRFASGSPRTPVVGSYYNTKDAVFEPVFGTQNSLRLPAFWQLDARVERSFALGEESQLTLSLECLNLTNHENAEEYLYDASYSERGVIRGLPIVVVIGAKVEL